MSDSREGRPASGLVSREAAEALLSRASILDREAADGFTIAELREAAMEAGISTRAVEAAMEELSAQGGADVVPTGEVAVPGGFIASAAYGVLGAALGTAAVNGSGPLMDLVLLGALLATVQLLVRHFGSGRVGPLLKEAAILWAAYSVAWVVGGADPWPHLFALPPLALTVTALVGMGRALTGRRKEDSPGSGGEFTGMAGAVPEAPAE